MAVDSIHHYVEEMVPELEDLQRKGVFTADEIRSIVKRRTNFEYLIKRSKPDKESFLRYIQYELNLEQLRKRRRRRLGKFKRYGASEVAIVKRIHFIFDRALRKFKSDPRMWLQYIDFCKKTKAHKRLARVFARCVEAHPTKPAFWIMAAAFEYETHHNMRSARALLQRGLRINKDSPALWHEYARLELLYMHKLQERYKVLGILPELRGEGSGVDGPKKAAEEEDEGEGEGEDGDGGEELTPEERHARMEPILRAAVPRAVFRNAITAFPLDLNFREQFLSLFGEFENTEEAVEDVYASIAADFPSSARAQAILLSRTYREAEAREKSFAYYLDLEDVARSTMKELSTCATEMTGAEMWEQAAAFAHDHLDTLVEGGNKKQIKGFVGALHRLYETAQEQDGCSADMFIRWTQLLCDVCADYTQLSTLLEAATQTYPSNSELWTLRVEVAVRHYAAIFRTSEATNSGVDDVETLIHDAIQALSGEEGADVTILYLWVTWVRAVLGCGAKAKAMVAIFERAQREETRRGGDGSIACMWIEWAFAAGGLAKTRKTYEAILKWPNQAVSVYRTCLDIEMGCMQARQLVNDEQDSTAHIRALFEKATDEHGEDGLDLWLEFLKWEISLGTQGNSARIYWKAVKKLEDPSDFMKEWSLHINAV